MPTDPTTLDKAAKYLNSFKTAEGMRARCRRLKLKGKRGCCLRCIVAKLLAAKFRRKVYFFPGVKNANVRIGPDSRTNYSRSVFCPVAVGFAINFDAGKYPELEAR